VLETLLDPPLPLTLDIHKAAIDLSRYNKLAFYDGLIIAAAVRAGCNALYSEDLQDGREMESLTIRNPFA